jgi:hypothetical protein
MKPYQVKYRWQEAGVEKFGHSVSDGMSQADAELRFQAQNPHVEVIPMPEKARRVVQQELMGSTFALA